MDRKIRASAFSDASTQAAALDEWKRRNAQHKKTANSLQRKVQKLRSDSEAVRKASQWLQERDRLNREQEACEAYLQSSYKELGLLVYDPRHTEREMELAALKPLLLQQLRDVGALTHGTPNHATSPTDSLTRLRDWIALEMEDARAAAAALTSSEAHSVGSTVEEDIRAAARKAEETFMRLCDLYKPSDGLQHIFAAAMASAEAEARARLDDLQLSSLNSVDADVLHTVVLIIKMGHQARQFNLSAASQAALAERVTAVFPDLTPAQVRQAIDAGLTVRHAQAAARAALADYQRGVAALVSSCESAFVVAKRAEEERLEKVEAARRRDSEQANRHARLAERRASHEDLLRRRRSEEEQRRRAAAAKADALQSKRAAEFQERLALLQTFEAHRTLLRQKERELQEMKARAAEEERAARMQHNEARVEYRRAQEEERRRHQKAQEEEVAALQREKQQALERFFASVDKQLGVEADPLRIFKATSSSAQTESYETLAQTTRPSIAGFSDEQIMKDPRVRLYHALLAAGLHTTPYGREVVTRGYHVAPSQMSSENNPLRGQFS